MTALFLQFWRCKKVFFNLNTTRRHSILISNPRRGVRTPPSECRWIAVLLCKVLVCKTNILILWPWPLTFEPQNSVSFRISQDHFLHKFEHFGIIRFWVMQRTNEQTDRQTDRQTDGLKNPTHADRHSRRAWLINFRTTSKQMVGECRPLNRGPIWLINFVTSAVHDEATATVFSCSHYRLSIPCTLRPAYGDEDTCCSRAVTAALSPVSIQTQSLA